LYLLDDTQSFMKASPPPTPFDQQSLVTLNFLYLLESYRTILLLSVLGVIFPPP